MTEPDWPVTVEYDMGRLVIEAAKRDPECPLTDEADSPDAFYFSLGWLMGARLRDQAH